jgi:hypothetical protein
VIRKVYLKKGIGMGALRRMYGGGQRRGVNKKIFVKGAGGVVRHILKQLEVRMRMRMMMMMMMMVMVIVVVVAREPVVVVLWTRVSNTVVAFIHGNGPRVLE